MPRTITARSPLSLRPPRLPFWRWLKDFLIREDRQYREAHRYDALDAAARRDMGLPPRSEPPRLPGAQW
ncbi:hypothetical protein [Salipiger mangrovisoli]|uniref:DUF1127 domain-containing protein n=1 Tax=Salipiger mangrovisoli TaxID=2865933 RepID=A0ABR9WVC5_9RHOB|nr:hypothetical protein [Salipiger mangrovisoli]MBE9635239.1 hypothetical protein [Salipiger mangrovisoli]